MQTPSQSLKNPGQPRADRRIVLEVHTLSRGRNQEVTTWRISCQGGRFHVSSKIAGGSDNFSDLKPPPKDADSKKYRIDNIYKVDLYDDRPQFSSRPLLVEETLLSESTLNLDKGEITSDRQWVFGESKFSSLVNLGLSMYAHSHWYLKAKPTTGDAFSYTYCRLAYALAADAGQEGSDKDSVADFSPSRWNQSYFGEVIQRKLQQTEAQEGEKPGIWTFQNFSQGFYRPLFSGGQLGANADDRGTPLVISEFGDSAATVRFGFLNIGTKEEPYYSFKQILALKGRERSFRLRIAQALAATPPQTTTAGLPSPLPVGEAISIRAEEAQSIILEFRTPTNLRPGPQGSSLQNPSPGASLPPVNARKRILEVFGLSGSVFANFWKQLAEYLYRGVAQESGGLPVSLVPLLEATSNQEFLPAAAWTARYEIQDETIQAKDDISYRFVNPLEPQDPSQPRRIRFHSFYPAVRNRIDELRTALRLPNIRRIENGGPLDGLEAAVSLHRYGSGSSNEYQRWCDELRPGLHLLVAGSIGAKTQSSKHRVRFGSFDLFLSLHGGKQEGETHCRLSLSHRGTVEVESNLKVRLERWSPGGQDGRALDAYAAANESRTNYDSICLDGFVEGKHDVELGDDLRIEGMYRREAPLVIDLNPTRGLGNGSTFLLRSEESCSGQYSHAIDLFLNVDSAQPEGIASRGAENIRTCEQPSSSLERVIVIDRQPFIAAQVAYAPFTQSESGDKNIAEWSNRRGKDSGWQVRFNPKSRPCLTLPPQSVGEAMLGTLKPLGSSTPPAPPEFRKYAFGPTAQVEIDVSGNNLVRTLAPWNLRELTQDARLAQFIERIDYELLYGLSCTASKPNLRLTETFGAVGEIPGRLPEALPWQQVSEDQKTKFLKLRKSWAKAYRRYTHRVAIYEPALPTVPASSAVIVSNPALSCWFRLPPASTMKPPFGIEVQDLKDQSKVEALNNAQVIGGATAGFASKNVFLASVFEPNSAPLARLSDSAQLSQFGFSALGAYGLQMAGFQNSLTKVYADAHLGRTYQYKLERIGRIACLGNIAKHVVVFQRTVTASKQFHKDQAPVAGFPVLRKVQEYIEIIEEKKLFQTAPSGTIPSNDPSSADASRRCGFAAGVQFQPGQQFPVAAEWGTELGDYGWKIPLWNPSADSSIYPRPEFSLLLKPFDQSNKEWESQCFSEPNQVYFYTLTKLKDPKSKVTIDPPGNPALWPQLPGLDYVNAPDPTPGPGFYPQDARNYGAPDTAIPPAFAACTFSLAPSPNSVNLVAGRIGVPASVNLSTITLSRSTPGAKVEFDGGGSAEQMVLALTQGLEKRLIDLFQNLLKDVPIGDILDPDLKNKLLAKINVELNQKFAELNADLDRLQSELTAKYESKFEESLKNLETGIQRDILARLREAAVRAAQAVEDRLNREADTAGNISKERANAIIADFSREIEQQLLLLSTLPGAFDRQIAEVALSIANAVKLITAGLDALLEEARKASARIEVLRDKTKRYVKESQDALERIAAPGTLPQVPGFLDPAAHWKEALKTHVDYAKTFLTKIEGALAGISTPQEFVAKVGEWKQLQELRSFSNPKTVTDAIKAVLPAFPEAADFEALRQEIERIVSGKRELLIAEWNKKVNTILQMEAASKARVLELVRLLSDAIEKESGELQKTLKTLVDNAVQDIDKKKGAVTGTIKNARAELQNLQDRIRTLVNGEANELLSKLEGERNRVVGAARDWATQYSGPLLDEVAKQAPGVFQTADGAIRLVRAFGEPPKAPQMAFDRSEVGYYFKQAFPTVDLTPVLSTVSKGAAVLEALKPLGIQLPCIALGDQLIPPSLKNLDLTSILKNIAGADLVNLFKSVKLPNLIRPEDIKVRHGIDKARGRAYAEADVDVTLDSVAVLLEFGPVKLQIPKARFVSLLRSEATSSGQISSKVNGSLNGDWGLVFSGSSLVTLKDATLRFDDKGGIRFDFDPSKVELPDILKFVTEKLSGLIDPNSGFSAGLVPKGFRCKLDLPIPDTQGVTSGVTGLRLGASLGLLFDQDFQIELGCSLGRPEAPFSVAIFILGGGGYLTTTLNYTPSKAKLNCRILLSVVASASIAIALGPIRGGVFIYLGITASFSSEGGGASFGVVFIIRGEVNLAGIVSAFVSISLSASYNSNSRALTGTGQLVVRIKICWCFTLEIDESVSYTVGGNGAMADHRSLDADPVLLASNGGWMSDAGPMQLPNSNKAALGRKQPKKKGLPGAEATSKYVDMLI